MPSWDIKLTRTLMDSHHGHQQSAQAKNCLRAVPERLRHARYHYQEARRLLKEAIDDRLQTESIYAITWPTTAAEMSEIDLCLMQVEANVIACAQAIHSVADNLAHVVCFSLGLNLGANAIQERDINIHRVTDALTARVPRYLLLRDTLKALTDDPAFKAVEAFVNVAKHRGYAESRINVGPHEDGTPYVFEFGAFAYRNAQYQERDVEAVLFPAYEVASKTAIQSGNAINAALSAAP